MLECSEFQFVILSPHCYLNILHLITQTDTLVQIVFIPVAFSQDKYIFLICYFTTIQALKMLSFLQFKSEID